MNLVDTSVGISQKMVSWCPVGTNMCVSVVSNLEQALQVLQLDAYFRSPLIGQLRIISLPHLREPLYNKGTAMLHLLHERFPSLTRYLFIDDCPKT